MSKLRKNYVSGTLRVHSRGFGFLIPDDRTHCPEDVFVPKFATAGAVDGDRVEVVLSPHPFSEKGPEGKVKKILERGRSCIGGTVVLVEGKQKSHAYAPLLGQDELVQLMPNTAKMGDRLLIQMLHWGARNKAPIGEVLGILGHIDDPSCDVRAACAEYEIDIPFSKEILDEAIAFGTEVTAEDEKGRVDFTAVETITIDPTTAKDFDDALSLEREGDGYHLVVHIADVSHYVTPESALDAEASKRCNSVYFPGTVVPMLPHELSSHLCSLKPHVKRLTLSVAMTFTATGELTHYEILRSVIKSDKRFTYEEAKEVLDGKLESPHRKTLECMVELCLLLKRHRASRGSIEFALPDTVVCVDEQGYPTRLEVIEYDITHQLVEEFMLKANEVVATHLSKLGKPLTYRIHEEPAEENIREFAALATALGFKVPKQPDNAAIQQLFDEARGSPFGKFLMTSFIRSMKLANYSTQNVGHYGLRLDHYTHFTSPIRRYIDLIVHRVLFTQGLPLTFLEHIATECSDKERLSAKAEQSVTTLKKLRHLSALIAEDPQRQFRAVITKVKHSGVLFELTECLLEGYVSLPNMHFDEARHQLCGPITYRTGDVLSVLLESMSLITLETRWTLYNNKRRR